MNVPVVPAFLMKMTENQLFPSPLPLIGHNIMVYLNNLDISNTQYTMSEQDITKRTPGILVMTGMAAAPLLLTRDVLGEAGNSH